MPLSRQSDQSHELQLAHSSISSIWINYWSLFGSALQTMTSPKYMYLARGLGVKSDSKRQNQRWKLGKQNKFLIIPTIVNLCLLATFMYIIIDLPEWINLRIVNTLYTKSKSANQHLFLTFLPLAGSFFHSSLFHLILYIL